MSTGKRKCLISWYVGLMYTRLVVELAPPLKFFFESGKCPVTSLSTYLLLHTDELETTPVDKRRLTQGRKGC